MQSADYEYRDQRIVKKEPKEITIITGSNKRNYGREILAKSFAAAATINHPKSVLTLDQLRDCGTAYINNGIVRSVTDKMVYFINGDRSGFVVEPNDEFMAAATDEEQKKLTDKIAKSKNIKELRRKVTRANKRVELNDRSQKLLTSALVFGRGALQIERFPKGTSDENSEGTWPIFGEPLALRHLSSTRIKDVEVDTRTGGFKGLYYEPETVGGASKFIKADDLIPAFHDDNSVLDNTHYSGLSAVWPIIPVAQAIDAINDEDIPEATRQTHSKFGFIYAGTSKKSTMRKIRETLESSTWLVHNEKELTAQVEDLARDLMELPNVRYECAKYICMSMNLPLFLLFEDTANFATANQVMQVFKAGMLNRYRTWYQGVLEKYWYDPILADHLGIELKDVISADIKIKATFPDINFETRLDIITADEKLHTMGVMNEIEIAKDIERDDIANRLELELNELGMSAAQDRQLSIQEEMQKRSKKVEEGEEDKEEEEDETA